jgi:hypothetical protein
MRKFILLAVLVGAATTARTTTKVTAVAAAI